MKCKLKLIFKCFCFKHSVSIVKDPPSSPLNCSHIFISSLFFKGSQTRYCRLRGLYMMPIQGGSAHLGLFCKGLIFLLRVSLPGPSHFLEAQAKIIVLRITGHT